MTKKTKVEVRCDEEEKAEWTLLAANQGQTLSDWLRGLANAIKEASTIAITPPASVARPPLPAFPRRRPVNPDWCGRCQRIGQGTKARS